MKKFLLLTTLMLMLGAQFANAQSVTYQISATIPVIVGVNVPDPAAEAIAESNAKLETFIEKTVWHGQDVLLETIVPL